LGVGIASPVTAALSKGATLIAASAGMRGYPLGIVAELVHILAMVLAILVLLGVVKRYSDRLASSMRLQSGWRQAALFFGLAALNLVLPVCPLLLTAGTARVLGPRDMVQVALVAAYANLLLPIAWSLLLIGLMIRVWKSIAPSP
jgi:hypothetical protein